MAPRVVLVALNPEEPASAATALLTRSAALLKPTPEDTVLLVAVVEPSPVSPLAAAATWEEAAARRSDAEAREKAAAVLSAAASAGWPTAATRVLPDADGGDGGDFTSVGAALARCAATARADVLVIGGRHPMSRVASAALTLMGFGSVATALFHHPPAGCALLVLPPP